MSILPIPHSEVSIASGGPTQSISPATLAGITPKAVRCTMSSALVDGTTADHSIISRGMSDGTRQQVHANGDAHAEGTSDGWVYMNDAAFICMIDASNGSLVALGSIALVSGGATITWSTVPDAAYVMDFQFFAGTDMVARCEINQSVPVSPGLIITSLAETPELLIAHWGPGVDAASPAAADAKMSTGAYDGTIQRCMSRNMRHGETTIRNYGRLDTNNILIDLGDTTPNNKIAASAFTSSGYTLIADTTTLTGVAILAISTGATADISLEDYDTPAVTGNDSLATMGAEPAMVMVIGGSALTRNSNKTGLDSHGYSELMFDANIERSVVSSSRDDKTTSLSYNLSDAKAIHTRSDENDADTNLATWVSMNSDGFTLNYTAATAAVFFAIGFEEITAPASIVAASRPLLLGI